MLPTKPKVHKNFKSVHLFGNFSYAIKDNGDVYSWGDNARGRLGLTSGEEKAEIPTIVPMLKSIKEINCGLWHVLALDVNGTVFSCGNNKNGECGREGTGGEGFQAIECAPMNHISAGFGVSFFVCMKDNRLHSCGSANLSL